MDVLSSLFRWLHVVAGIVWIGHLYFFNFVNGPFQTTIDGETKKKVNPELLPRALFWFRWGAAFTWVTGVLLLMLVFYHGQITLDTVVSWGPLQILMIVLVFVSPFIYDALCKTVFKEIGEVPYKLTIKGNTVVDINPEGTIYPLYQRDHYLQDEAPLKKVTRFVSKDRILW